MYALIDRTGYVVMATGSLGEMWEAARGLGNCAIARQERTCWLVIARRPANWPWTIGQAGALNHA